MAKKLYTHTKKAGPSLEPLNYPLPFLYFYHNSVKWCLMFIFLNANTKTLKLRTEIKFGSKKMITIVCIQITTRKMDSYKSIEHQCTWYNKSLNFWTQLKLIALFFTMLDTQHQLHIVSTWALWLEKSWSWLILPVVALLCPVGSEPWSIFSP